mmetsp:Transcript_17848/g.33971  ORF Transcript_17848/g.33971 Transcript_17848/m.33971 type:complete len:119 (+) Transcript_17848:176-532(+)
MQGTQSIRFVLINWPAVCVWVITSFEKADVFRIQPEELNSNRSEDGGTGTHDNTWHRCIAQRAAKVHRPGRILRRNRGDCQKCANNKELPKEDARVDVSGVMFDCFKLGNLRRDKSNQ